MKIRVGFGQDSHRFSSKGKNPLILGGILVDKMLRVEADSDGDVVLHALCLALSSAIGGRSLGFYEPQLISKGLVDSQEYLKFFLAKVEKKGFCVNNVSLMVEAKKPQVEPYAPKMKKLIARLLKIKEDAVGICFTSGEGLTAFGQGRGIQTLALVSLIRGETT